MPVELRDANLDAPHKVQVVEIRKTWDYETITLSRTDDVARILSAKGTVGWETTGVAFANETGTALLLKRQR